MATFELLTRSTRRPVAVIASIALVGHQPQTELAQQGNVARCIFEDRIDEHRLTVVAQPRAYTPGSIMPPYPYLFEVRKGAAQPGETVVNLPPSFANPGEVVIATPESPGPGELPVGPGPYLPGTGSVAHTGRQRGCRRK